MDNKQENFYVYSNTTESMSFLGGFIEFLGDAGGNYNTILSIDGLITMDGVTIDLNWNGAVPQQSDAIQDPDQTTRWAVTSKDVVNLTEYNTDTSHSHWWTPLRSFTALDNTGGDPTVNNYGSQTIYVNPWNRAGWQFNT